jgi:hypothetical protein
MHTVKSGSSQGTEEVPYIKVNSLEEAIEADKLLSSAFDVEPLGDKYLKWLFYMGKSYNTYEVKYVRILFQFGKCSWGSDLRNIKRKGWYEYSFNMENE